MSLPAICFICATVLIAAGAEHGWGWLLAIGFLLLM